MCVCVGVGMGVRGCFTVPILCVYVCVFSGLFIFPTFWVCLFVGYVLNIVLSVISSLEIILLMKREMVALS